MAAVDFDNMGGLTATKLVIRTGGDIVVEGTSLLANIESLAGLSSGELAVLDGVTAGTITASKAVVVDANKDISSFRNVTATGLTTTSTLTIGSTSIPAASFGTTGGLLSVYAAGTAYSVTNTAAAVTFGTTSPAKVISAAGTYILRARANLLYNGATFAANRTLTLKLRRTNNTPADVSGSSTALTTGVVTTLTNTFAIVDLPEVIYTTANTDDSISLFAGLDTVPTAGSLDITEASIIARRVG